MKIAYITTIPETQLSFLRGQNAFMRDRGFELHAICSPGPALDRLAERDGVTPHPVPLSRSITPLKDLVSLFRLVVALREIRPEIAHISTPKAALLGAIAARVAGIPVRVFLVRGLITENARGWKRALFRGLERLTARLSTRAICVAPTLLDFARDQGILPPGQGVVLGEGMSNGIDAARFDPDRVATAGVVPGEGPVVGFVGRLAADKGLGELHEAWSMVRDDYPAARLLVVGPWEAEDPVSPRARQGLEADPRVVLAGRQADVAPFLARMSMVVAPSHGTEGFPNAIMEASAMGLPVIATRVVGCMDAIVDGRTGMLVPPRDPHELARAIRTYLDDPDLGRSHGAAGRERVLRDFRQEVVWEALYCEYVALIREARLTAPGHVHPAGGREGLQASGPGERIGAASVPSGPRMMTLAEMTERR